MNNPELRAVLTEALVAALRQQMEVDHVDGEYVR